MIPRPVRLFHLSDLHVLEGPRLEDQAANLARILDRAAELRPDLVTLTGDYYGRQVPHRPTAAEREVFEPALVRLAELAPVVLLGGNHDHELSTTLARHLGGLNPITVETAARAWTVDTAAGPVDLYALAYPTKRWILSEADAAKGITESMAAVNVKLASLLKVWASRIARRRRSAPTVPQVLLAHVQIRGCLTSGGEVLAGQELELGRPDLEALGVDYAALGHLHRRQAVASRAWYVGSPWPVDFAEGRDPHGFHLVELGETPRPILFPTMAAPPRVTEDGETTDYPADGTRLRASVTYHATGSRPWITLDYRWAPDNETGIPRWIKRPTAAELEAVPGAELRARLVVPDTFATTCPWDAELETLAGLGAHRVQPERTIEPTERIRVPAVVEAVNLAGKVEAYWTTLATPLGELETGDALEALGELETMEDPEIGARSRQLLAG
jgi:exonuclease SbcD